MAKQKIETKTEDQPVNKASRIQAFLNKHKINEFASTMATSEATKIREWISSGCYSLNKVISGSYYKGFADNRMYVIAGPSGTGKTLITSRTVGNAQKMGYTVAYFDSEGACDKEQMARLGVNVDELIIIPIDTISNFKLQAIHFVNNWREEYGPDSKLMIVCDSIGNLSGTKETNDMEENKSVSDMGQRAKELKAASRVLSQMCMHKRVLMICTNHTYEQPAANPNAAPTIKMSGGEGFYYMASGIIYLKKRAEREEVKDVVTGKAVKEKTGNILIATSEKNRFVPEGTKGEVYLSFTKGLSPYYGLLNDAVESGLFEKTTTRITVKHLNKSFFESQIYTKECFGPILDDLNAWVEKKYKFATLTSDENPVELEDEKIDEEVTPATEDIKDTNIDE